MSIGSTVGGVAKRIDRQLGIRPWLRGEPRPPAGGFDLAGEKILDWGWICANLPQGRRRALEIGSGISPIVPAMLTLGYDVTAVDLCEDLSRQVSGFRFFMGDFNSLSLDPWFDIVVLCSVVEHMGLSGRFNSNGDPEADLKTMRKVQRLLAPDGLVFLTIPVGQDVVHVPWHRVYGTDRLPRLLDGFTVTKSRFLVKEPWGPWNECDRETAVACAPDIQRYALGEFILRNGNSKRTEGLCRE